MKFRKVVTIIFAIVCVAAVASSALAQETKTASANGGPSQPGAEPLSKKRLLKLLTLNDSTQPELIQIVGQKGVDFKATPSDERELHDAGASDDLIVAVRANYRNEITRGDKHSKVPIENPPAASIENERQHFFIPTHQEKAFLQNANRRWTRRLQSSTRRTRKRTSKLRLFRQPAPRPIKPFNPLRVKLRKRRKPLRLRLRKQRNR